MNYHGRMMNIPADEDKRIAIHQSGRPAYDAYGKGHRDARHAAAEIANEADAEIENYKAANANLLSELKAEIRSRNKMRDEAAGLSAKLDMMRARNANSETLAARYLERNTELLTALRDLLPYVESCIEPNEPQCPANADTLRIKSLIGGTK